MICSKWGGVLFGVNDDETIKLRLRVSKLDVPDDCGEQERSEIEKENEAISKEIDISNKIDDILLKLKTQGYTKQVVLRTGFVRYEAERVSNNYYGEVSRTGDVDLIDESPLFQLVVNVSSEHKKDCSEVTLEVVDSSVKVLIEQFNKYLPSKEYDELFGYLADIESNGDMSLPLAKDVLSKLWSEVTFRLNKQGARGISNDVDVSKCKLTLVSRANYFLADDLKKLSAMDRDDLGESSLSAWESDEEMNIEEEVHDDGSTELFFPFEYDKWQLSVLGVLKNRSAIVEGPPGTGKSQTIANLLAHLAATGNTVLFASQKDQAVRGVKNTLKKLNIRFLFGYIPDRSSPLNASEDEVDSASNTLLAINQEFQKMLTQPDHKLPLQMVNKDKGSFVDSINAQRRIFQIDQRLREIDYIKSLAMSNIDKTAVGEYDKLLNEVDEYRKQLGDVGGQMVALSSMKQYADLNLQFAINDVVKYGELASKLSELSRHKDALANKLADYVDTKDTDYSEIEFNGKEAYICSQINSLCNGLDELLPDGRANALKNLQLRIKVKGLCNSLVQDIYQEVATNVEVIAMSKEMTKARKMHELRRLRDYFALMVARNEVSACGKEMCSTVAEIAEKTGSKIAADVLDDFLSIPDGCITLSRYCELSRKRNEIMGKIKGCSSLMSAIVKQSSLSAEEITRLSNMDAGALGSTFSDIEEYRKLLDERKTLAKTCKISPNDINQEIMQLKQYCRKDVCSYIQNRILNNVERLKSDKHAKARIERISRSLNKSKKAYKTFDKLKSDPDNFKVMSSAIPVWMMSLEDVSRIVPAEVNCFDYVIIDEASQCNIAYALPVMMRAKHTIFFGDSLQMRDTNTLFKSNEQLSSIAKKHDVPEEYQIKAEEDTVKSVMDIATLAGFRTVVLKNHYRSPRQLIGFSNHNFYKKVGRGLEVVNDNIVEYKDTERVMLNHVIAADPTIEISEKTNESEARYIIGLINDIRSDSALCNKSIAVLTFFNEQAELLQRMLDGYANVKVSTIEGIQGDERDIVIYSFVITDPVAGKKRYMPLTGEGGEIRRSANEGRVNVAFSRAREQVHCVTSLPLDLWPEKIWVKKFLKYVEENGSVSYQHEFDEQHFDSDFEAQVFRYLAGQLSPREYLLQTQVKSCGFRIDLVVRQYKSGLKLAIECDGPTHFENGDGQVYVMDDYERQGVLESAGWNFYRLSYFDFVEDKEKALEGMLNFIQYYFAHGGTLKSSSKVLKRVEKLRLSEVLPEAKCLPKYKTVIKDSERAKPSPSMDTLFAEHKVGVRSTGASIGTIDGNGVAGQIDQDDFERYLIDHLGKTICVRYWPMRKVSPDAKYRTLKLVSFNSKYFYCRRDDADSYSGSYLRDRVVDYR